MSDRTNRSVAISVSSNWINPAGTSNQVGTDWANLHTAVRTEVQDDVLRNLQPGSPQRRNDLPTD